MHHAPIADDVGEEEDGRNTPVSDNEAHAKVDDEEDGSSEDNVDDAINRDIIAREPPRVSTSLSRTTSSANGSRHRSALFDTGGRTSSDLLLPSSPPEDQDNNTSMNATATSNTAFKEIQKKLEKAAKRQSITARFLSSLTKSDGLPASSSPSRPSLDHIMSSFQELSSAKPASKASAIPPTSPIQLAENDTESSIPNEKLTIDVALPIKLIEKKESLVKDMPVEDIPVKKPIETTITTQQEDDSSLENALADLDGVSILLDSVLEVYLSKLKSASSNNKAISTIEGKLTHVADKISKTLQKEALIPPSAIDTSDNSTTTAAAETITTTTTTSPETINLLEKYSALLLNMVENKLNK